MPQIITTENQRKMVKTRKNSRKRRWFWGKFYLKSRLLRWLWYFEISWTATFYKSNSKWYSVSHCWWHAFWAKFLWMCFYTRLVRGATRGRADSLKNNHVTNILIKFLTYYYQLIIYISYYIRYRLIYQNWYSNFWFLLELWRMLYFSKNLE